jgi:hypothetical protein
VCPRRNRIANSAPNSLQFNRKLIVAKFNFPSWLSRSLYELPLVARPWGSSRDKARLARCCDNAEIQTALILTKCLSSKLPRPASTTRLPPVVYATLDQLPTVSASAALDGLAVNGSLNSVQPIDLRPTSPASPDRAGLTLRSLAALKAFDPTPDTVLLSAQEAKYRLG